LLLFFTAAAVAFHHLRLENSFCFLFVLFAAFSFIGTAFSFCAAFAAFAVGFAFSAFFTAVGADALFFTALISAAVHSRSAAALNCNCRFLNFRLSE
jgi:hypothetical protein